MSTEARPERNWSARLSASVHGVLLLVVLGLAAATVGGFGGRLWWVFDGLSHFRVQYFGGLLLAGLLLCGIRRSKTVLLAAAFCALNGGLIAPLYFGAPAAGSIPAEAPRLRIVSINLLSSNRSYEEVRRFVREVRPDLVVFIEVENAWAEQLRPLQDELPHVRVRAQDDNFGMAVYSRLPLEEFEFHLIEPNCPAAVARLRVGEQTLTIVGAHPVPPGGDKLTRRRNQQLRKLIDIANQQERPLGLVGDLNTTSWSPIFDELAEETGLRDSRDGFGVQPTWPADALLWGVPIDHCLVSKKLVVTDRRVGPDIGSDHLPIIVDMALVPE